jgi:hypothetical protein
MMVKISSQPPSRNQVPERPAWQRAVVDFGQGLVSLSFAGFTAMVAGFLYSVVFAFWFFSEMSLAGANGDYLPRSGRDDEAFATVTALRTGQDRANDAVILILGSSILAQAIGDGEALTHKLASDGFGNWQVRMMTTPLQSPLDQFALLEIALRGQTAQSAPVIVLVGAGPTRPGWSAAKRQLEEEYRDRIGLTSSWERDEREILGEYPSRPWGVSLIDNRKFFVLNGTEAILRYLLRAPARRQIDSYANGKVNPKAQNILATSFAKLPDRMNDYLEQIDRLIGRLRAIPGVRVAFVEEPISPGFIQAFGLAPIVGGFNDRMYEEAHRRGLPYFLILDAAGLAVGDYHDILHMRRGPGQVVYQKVLGDQLISAFGKEVTK